METLLNQITEIARRAARIMLESENSPAYRKEGHYNFVTDADVAVQQTLIRELSALLPQAEFFAEEKENQRLTDAPTFIIDPIDGTLNFMRRRHCSAMSIALIENRQPVLGMIYDPYADEMFTALRGKGAWLNGQPIHVSDVQFESAMVACGTSPYYADLAHRTMDIAYDFLTQAGDLRRIGSAALDMCYLACGRTDIFYELKLSPWDYAAGGLIVTEAGGIFELPSDDMTTTHPFDVPGMVFASNPACVDRARELLRKHS